MTEQNQLIPIEGHTLSMREQAAPPSPFALTTFADVEKMAGYIAESHLYCFKKPAQCITAMLMAHEEQTTMIQLMKRVHFFDDGKVAQRADWTQGNFEQSGMVIWHVRSDDLCAASFYRDKTKVDDKAKARGIQRFKALWKLEFEKEPELRSELILELAEISEDGETTIIRTLEDAISKGIALNSEGNMRPVWTTSPRQMLSARVVTEGVRVVDPARAAGLYSEDEVQDIQKAEQQQRQGIARNPQPQDREAIEAIIAQHLEDAKNATSQGEKSRLLGLASELRCKLAELPGSEDNSNPSVTPAGTKKDDPENAAMAARQETKVIDAKTTVLPPEKDQLPGLENPDPAPPQKWQDYTIQFVKSSAYKGKQLSALTKEEVEILYKKRSIPFKEDKDAGLRTEADMIRQALESWSQPGAEG